MNRSTRLLLPLGCLLAGAATGWAAAGEPAAMVRIEADPSPPGGADPACTAPMRLRSETPGQVILRVRYEEHYEEDGAFCGAVPETKVHAVELGGADTAQATKHLGCSGYFAPAYPNCEQRRTFRVLSAEVAGPMTP